MGAGDTGIRVCIVDPLEADRSHAAAALRKQGFIADEMPEINGAGAAWAYDALVLDVFRLGSEGLTTLSTLRSASPMALLVLTDRDDEESRVAAFAAGADDYVTRPFFPGDLGARLALRCAAAGHRRPKSLVMSHDGRSLLFDGHPLRLTRREQSLLGLLVANPGRLFTREELLDEIWGSDWESPGIVTEYIRRLRVHLRRRGIDGCIVTRHGFGYLYDPQAPADA